MRFTFIILPSPHIMHSIRSNQKVLITIFSIQLFYCIKYSYLNITGESILKYKKESYKQHLPFADQLSTVGIHYYCTDDIIRGIVSVVLIVIE